MKMNSFVVLGSTANKEKTAYEIKEELKKHNKTVYCVREEYNSIEEIKSEIDVLDICMNSKYSIDYINNNLKVKGVIIQPGAESEELYNKLKELNIPFFNGCVLVGLKRLDNE